MSNEDNILKEQRCETLIKSIHCLTSLLDAKGLQMSSAEKALMKGYIVDHATTLSQLNLPHIFAQEDENEEEK